MRDALRRLREAWENTSQTNRILLAATVAAGLFVGTGTLYWASRPEYVALNPDAAPRDTQAILAYLDGHKVDYRVRADGATIEVPAVQRPKLLMALASEKLLNSGSLGYGLLDKVPFGQTQAMEQLTIKRAAEGELENAIGSLEQVSDARVTYAPGESSPFVTQTREPTASVVVHVKPGFELDKNNVRAIATLVGHAFTGLDPEKVTVVDGQMNQLWPRPDTVAGGLGAAERRAQEREYEEQVARRVQQQVRAVVGAGKFTATVSAVLNLDSQREERREVTAGAPRVKETVSEKYSGAGAAGIAAARPANGGAGGPANPPAYAAVDPGAGEAGGTYAGEQSTTTMDNAVTETHIERAPGEVKALAVSLLLDSSVPQETADAIRKDIETLVGAGQSAAAAGRRVSVQRVTLDQSAREAERKAASEAASAERIARWLNYGLPIAVVLIMLLILARSLRSPASRQLALARAPQGALAGAGAGGGQLDIRVGDAPLSARGATGGDGDEGRVVGVTAAETDHVFEVIPEAFDSNLESILHLSKSNPEIVASLVRGWLSEDKK